MKYLTVKELTKINRAEASKILSGHIGKGLKDNFVIEIFNQYYTKLFDNKSNTKILDLGAASGAFTNRVNQEGYNNLYGVDVDDYVKDENKSLFKEFKTVDLSLEPLPWSDNFFNVVTAWCVLPHLENPFHCIREIHRVLDKDGLFIFTAPFLASKPSIDYFIKNKDFGSYKGSNNHLVLFTRGVVEKAVLKYFDLLGIEYHFRSKIFRGLHGKARSLIYKIISRSFPHLKKSLAKRWAYNIIYILKKK